jgi:hypothetical protein
MRNLMNQGNQKLVLIEVWINCYLMLPVDSFSIISMASLPLINNLKMDLIDNDEFKTGLTACSGIYLAKVSLNFYFS